MKSDQDKIAHGFQIEYSKEVLDFFNQLALHYHYPAIPGTIFASLSFEQDNTEKWHEKIEFS